jgi:hypothetical protein
MVLLGRFSVYALLAVVAEASPVQIPLGDEGTRNDDTSSLVKKRPLHGKFLHITGKIRLFVFRLKRAELRPLQISIPIDSTRYTRRPPTMMRAIVGKVPLVYMVLRRVTATVPSPSSTRR